MNTKLLVWIIFWPSFLLSFLLNAIRSHYNIQDDRFLIISFAIFIPFSAIGIMLPVKMAMSRNIDKKASLDESPADQ
jgi:hypothetical protein